MKPPAPPRTMLVSIVSKNAETVGELRAYFESVGIRACSTRAVRDVDAVAPSEAIAAVIFPDDYGEKEMLELVRALRQKRPRLLALLVTREPNRFRGAIAADGKSLPPLVLPRPSFGWEIVDAIRAHAAAKPG